MHLNCMIGLFWQARCQSHSKLQYVHAQRAYGLHSQRLFGLNRLRVW